MSKKYIVVRSFYEGNGLHEEGQAFEHTDADYIKKCLEDGNIEEVSVEAEGSSDPAPSTPAEGATADPAPLAPDSGSNPEDQDKPQSVQPADSPVPQSPNPAPQQPTQSEIEATLASTEGASSAPSEKPSDPSGDLQIS